MSIGAAAFADTDDGGPGATFWPCEIVAVAMTTTAMSSIPASLVDCPRLLRRTAVTLHQTAVHRFHEHVGRPFRISAEPRIPILGWFRRLHLRERHLLFDHVVDAIADDRDHVAIIRQLGDIADAPVRGNNERSTFRSGVRD